MEAMLHPSRVFIAVLGLSACAGDVDSTRISHSAPIWGVGSAEDSDEQQHNATVLFARYTGSTRVEGGTKADPH